MSLSDSMTKRLAVGVLTVAFTVPVSGRSAQSAASLEAVLDRLGQYLTAYAEDFFTVIATEHYRQTSRGAGPNQVMLESEFGVVRVADHAAWLGFRDVLRVNGEPVRDHDNRLQNLLLNPSRIALEQASRIAQESARFNVGAVQRTVNNPTIILELLDRRNRSRFRFSAAGEDTIRNIPVVRIRFQERSRPTVIHTPRGDDVPADGYAWVDPGSGRLLKAETNFLLVLPSYGPSRASMAVTFQEDKRLRMWMPERLTERYAARGDMELITGEATYTNYRQFHVETTEELGPILQRVP